jgi:hypothetical protein
MFRLPDTRPLDIHRTVTVKTGALETRLSGHSIDAKYVLLCESAVILPGRLVLTGEKLIPANLSDDR